MSEQTGTQSRTETAKERKAREAAATAAAATAAAGTPATGSQDGQEGTEAATPATPRAKAPDTSTVALDAINAATLAAPDLITASAPMRERSDQQKAMDKVAARAYEAWVKADRPSVWAKIPVVTYFLSEDDVKKYRYLIRRACAIVEPVGDSAGVRVRFGNEFTLSEAMAEKIGRPDDSGKTVLAWAAVDKRTMEDKPDENK